MCVVKLEMLWSPCCPAKGRTFTDSGRPCADNTRDDDRGQLYGCVRHRESLQLLGVGHLTRGEGERMKRRTERRSKARSRVFCRCQGSTGARTVKLDDGGGRENGNRRGDDGRWPSSYGLSFCYGCTATSISGNTSAHHNKENEPPSMTASYQAYCKAEHLHTCTERSKTQPNRLLDRSTSHNSR